MQEVNIYIDAYHTGHLKRGTGVYSIVIEFMTSIKEPATLDFIKGIKGTTKNRTALQACIKALSHIKVNRDIKLYINSKYVTEAVRNDEWFSWINTGLNKKGKPAKNIDLWQQLLDLVDKQHVEFIYCEENSYTACRLIQIKNQQFSYKEDTNNV